MAATPGFVRTAIGLFLVLVLLTTWESMSIILKGMETTYHESFFISYVCRSSYIICIPIWWILKTATGRKHDALPQWRGHLFVFLMSFISIWGIFAWYKSLAMTDIAFNNAIYQTTSVFVYLLSIPILKMKVNAYGISALVLALGGLALVTWFSPSDSTLASCPLHNSTTWEPLDLSLANMSTFTATLKDCCSFCEDYNNNATTSCISWVYDASTTLCRVSDRNVTMVNTTITSMTAGTLTPAVDSSSVLGYMLCLVSVIAYAFFEIFYKKFERYLEAPPAKTSAKAVTHGEVLDLKSSDRLSEDLPSDEVQSTSSSSVNGEYDAEHGVANAQGEAVEEKLDVLTPVLDCLKFLGLMGLYTLISVAPFVYILDVAEVEVFVNPFTMCGEIQCFSYMLIDGGLDMTYNVCLLIGISLTSPRFMSAGTIMIIPVGVVVDTIQHPDLVWNAYAIVGAVIIILSFFVMEFLELVVNATCRKPRQEDNRSSSKYKRIEA